MGLPRAYEVEAFHHEELAIAGAMIRLEEEHSGGGFQGQPNE